MVDMQTMGEVEFEGTNLTCNGWLETALDVFVTTKAIVLVYMCA